ncbi:transcription factor Pcc1 [Colletotrichum tofieldiae]|nr:transcription factor Pcc1 [Colletotrichum tofieldiae]
MADDNNNTADDEFPCSLTIDVPFPTPRLASVAHKALAVDQELSPLATTNRMLRVAVNGLMESLNLVVEVMEELDVDVLEHGRDAQ